jgi:hypothetical protein
MTTVYKDTQKPFDEWVRVPVYEIVMTYDGGTPSMNWLPYHTLDAAKVIANILAKKYDAKQRFNMHRTDIPRYKKEYIESACVFLNKLGYTADVKYNEIDDNHCHTITLRRR